MKLSHHLGAPGVDRMHEKFTKQYSLRVDEETEKYLDALEHPQDFIRDVLRTEIRKRTGKMSTHELNLKKDQFADVGSGPKIITIQEDGSVDTQDVLYPIKLIYKEPIRGTSNLRDRTIVTIGRKE